MIRFAVSPRRATALQTYSDCAIPNRILRLIVIVCTLRTRPERIEYTKFGCTGLRVSRLCLGTMTFGFQCDEGRSHAIMDAASAGGIDFFDTAHVYPLGGGRATSGRTEEIVGAWLRRVVPRRVV